MLGPVAVPGFALFHFIFFLSFGSSFPETPDVSPLIRSSLGRTPWDLAVSSGRLRGPPPLRRRRRSPGMRETLLPGEPPGPPRCAAGLRALLSVLTSPRSPYLSLSRGATSGPTQLPLPSTHGHHGARSVMCWGCPRGRRGHRRVPRRCLPAGSVIGEVTRALDIETPDHTLPLKTGASADE